MLREIKRKGEEKEKEREKVRGRKRDSKRKGRRERESKRVTEGRREREREVARAGALMQCERTRDYRLPVPKRLRVLFLLFHDEYRM